jgi:hypothetical protein
MNFNPKAPPVYKPTAQKSACPQVYRPHQAVHPGVQPKSPTDFRLERRPPPPVYRPQSGSGAGAQPKAAGNLRIETHAVPPVYKPQPAAKNLQRNACHARGIQLPAPATFTPAGNCAQPKSLLFAPVIQRASSKKCPACNGPLLPTGKCPTCKKVMVAAEKPVVKDKAKEERRRKKEQEQLKKADAAKKQEIAELGSKKGAVSAWESDKANFFEEFAGATVVSPPNTTEPKYPIKILDIDTVVSKGQPKLAQLLLNSLDSIQVRPNTPEHQNNEGRFPGYAEGEMAYWEFSYLGGGGRLVVDAIAGIIYISAHYSYNYKLVKGGEIPQGPVRVARQQRTAVLDWERRVREEAAARKAEEMSSSASPVSPGLSLSPYPSLSSGPSLAPLPPALSGLPLRPLSIISDDGPGAVRHQSFASPDDPVFISHDPRHKSSFGAVGDRKPHA